MKNTFKVWFQIFSFQIFPISANENSPSVYNALFEEIFFLKSLSEHKQSFTFPAISKTVFPGIYCTATDKLTTTSWRYSYSANYTIEYRQRLWSQDLKALYRSVLLLLLNTVTNKIKFQHDLISAATQS